MNDVKQYPFVALRACFHFPDGSTDTKRAAEFFGVSQRTVQHWIKSEQMPPPAIKLLTILYKGYLPDNEHWKDFYIIGDKMYFQGWHGLRSLHPRQIRSLDFIVPAYLPNENQRFERFWSEYTMKYKIKPVH